MINLVLFLLGDAETHP